MRPLLQAWAWTVGLHEQPHSLDTVTVQICRLAYAYTLYIELNMHMRTQALSSREQFGVPKALIDMQ